MICVNSVAMKSAQNILLVRPAGFGYNDETQATNAFQAELGLSPAQIQERAVSEFDAALKSLRNAGVSVTVFDDTTEPVKPDAVFPNNWVSFHEEGTVILYPMFAENRRPERRMDILEALGRRFEINEIVDLTSYEDEGRYLEGTGSIVFDHDEKTAYACLSPRTDEGLLSMVCARIGYRPISFRAYDRDAREIYHTNVMMCIAKRFAVACLESVRDKRVRAMVADSLISRRA